MTVLSALPPTTPQAQQYFFTKIWEFASLAAETGKGKINFDISTNEWNSSADSKD